MPSRVASLQFVDDAEHAVEEGCGHEDSAADADGGDVSRRRGAVGAERRPIPSSAPASSTVMVAGCLWSVIAVLSFGSLREWPWKPCESDTECPDARQALSRRLAGYFLRMSSGDTR